MSQEPGITFNVPEHTTVHVDERLRAALARGGAVPEVSLFAEGIVTNPDGTTQPFVMRVGTVTTIHVEGTVTSPEDSRP